jgi:alpha-1,4-digalacturonate transport system permease protein
MASLHLAHLADRLLDRIMLLVEAPINGVERLIGKKRMPYVFLAPNLLLFGIFTFLPIAIAVGYAFTGGTELLLTNRPFVGLENFGKLLNCESYLAPGSCEESLFWIAIWNTLWFVAFNVVATLLVALVTALILNRAMAGRGFFRAMFFYPVLLSPVVIGLIWKWFLDRNGLLNAFFQLLGVPPEIFLLEVGWSRLFVVVVSVWFHMGFYTLILLAGLQAIQ